MEKDTKGKECLPFNVKFKGNFIIDEENDRYIFDCRRVLIKGSFTGIVMSLTEILVRYYIENEGTRQTLMDLVNETYLSTLKEKEEKGRVI